MRLGLVASLCLLVAASTPLLSGCKRPALTSSVAAADGDMPPPGTKSLFDKMIEKAPDGRIPYPFKKLINYVGGYAESQFGALLPLGRSLQKNMAEPNYFKFPRAVVTFGGDNVFMEPRRLDAASTIFFGFQPEAHQVEVISYNEDAGRFEFQIIENYGKADQALHYEKRDVCMACHKGGMPIFPVITWDETNLIPDNIALIQRHQTSDEFEGVPLDNKTANVTGLLDGNVRSTTGRILAHQIWKDGCRGDLAAVNACKGRLLLRSLSSSLDFPLASERRGQRLFPDAGAFKIERLEAFDTVISNRTPLSDLSRVKVQAILTAAPPTPARSPEIEAQPFSRKYVFDRPHLVVLARAMMQDHVRGVLPEKLTAAFEMAASLLSEVADDPEIGAKARTALAELQKMRPSFEKLPDDKKQAEMLRIVEGGLAFVALTLPLPAEDDPKAVNARKSFDPAKAADLFATGGALPINTVSRIRRAVATGESPTGNFLSLTIADLDVADDGRATATFYMTWHPSTPTEPGFVPRYFQVGDRNGRCEGVASGLLRCRFPKPANEREQSDPMGNKTTFGDFAFTLAPTDEYPSELSTFAATAGILRGANQVQCVRVTPELDRVDPGNVAQCRPYDFGKVEAALVGLIKDATAGKTQVLKSEAFLATKIADELVRRVGVDLASETFKEGPAGTVVTQKVVEVAGASAALKELLYFCGDCHNGSLANAPVFTRGADADDICQQVARQARAIVAAVKQGEGEDSYMPPAASGRNLELTAARRRALVETVEKRQLCPKSGR